MSNWTGEIASCIRKVARATSHINERFGKCKKAQIVTIRVIDLLIRSPEVECQSCFANTTEETSN